MLGKVIDMHVKFGLEQDERPQDLTPEEKAFRIVAMREEIAEYEAADALEDILDALVDLQVFLLGTVHRHGMHEVFTEAFNRVMAANLAKELAGTSEASKRGFARDLVKPEGWVAPDLKDLVK